MRSKPKGSRYRNLTARGGVIYYERVYQGKRIKLSAKTDDWEEAAAFRDLYEERTGLAGGVPFLEAPRFAEFAERYLQEATGHLAPTSRSDRSTYLRETGPLGAFSSHRLDDITPALLREWWGAEIEAKGRALTTGRALGAVGCFTNP